MARPLELADIADLRAYEAEREAFRRAVIELKRLRRVALGPLITVVLENRTTVRFQIQEMARAERMLSDAQIQGELDAYNPLIPGPGELSMTMFIELTSDDELRSWLPKLVGVERAVALHLGSEGDAETIAAELEEGHASQLTREEITASVHYLRVAMNPEQAERFRDGRPRLVVEHPEYRHEQELSEATKASVVEDWAAD